MVKVKSLGFGILVLLLMVNTCSAGLSSLVSPVDTEIVSPGESISYKVVVNDDQITDLSPQLSYEDVNFSINEADKQSGWTYTFYPSTVRLSSPTESKSSILTMKVSDDAAPGVYPHTLKVEAWNGFSYIDGKPSTTQTYVINPDVNNIPEFPTVALPMLAVFGLVAIFGKRKNKV